MIKKSLSALLSAALSLSVMAAVAPAANSTPSWVDFDSSVNAPYVGLENQGNAPIYNEDISAMHSIAGKYWFFRGPDLFSFDPSSQAAPTAVATTPLRSAGDAITGTKNMTFVYNDLIIYTGQTAGVWAYDTTNNTSYEIKAGANSLRHAKDFTVFNGTPIFIAQIQGSAVGSGWGIYSVDLSSRSGSPATYAATLRRASTFAINLYGGGFAIHGNLAFFSETQGSDYGAVWVMDNNWDSEALVDIDNTNNTQSGHMVILNGKLAFKARSSAGQGEYFVLDVSGITPTTVDGTPALMNGTNPVITRLTQVGGSVMDVQQAVAIGGRYIVVKNQNLSQSLYSYDSQTGNWIRLAESSVNNAPIRPYRVGGVDMALVSYGQQVRTYNPANGDFGVQVSDISSIAANGQVVYDFSLADTNGDGNSDIAAFGISTFNQPQRWFHAPVSGFMAAAAYKVVTFDANNGAGTMAPQLAATATNLTANAFTNTGFVFDGWNTDPNGTGIDYADGASFPFTADDVLYAQWITPPVAAGPYEGPVFSEFSSRTVDTCKPTTITVTGTNLSGVSAKLNGVAVKVLENTATKLVMQVPAGLTPAKKVDLVVTSSSGSLTVQDALEIRAGVCNLNISEGLWTKKQSATSIKFYAKSPIGEGKIQFFANGKEVAWVNAVDETDPKLTFASGYPYLVRTFELAPGKNRVEIRLDGVRIWRATYAKR